MKTRRPVIAANKTPSRRRRPSSPTPLHPAIASALQPQPSSWLNLFLDFISNLTIESRETGQTVLGQHLWGSQRRTLQELAAGMDAGIRDFTNLKSRQLGETTIYLAVDLFWLFLHPGIHGVLLIDDDGNRDKIRVILRQYAHSLPRGLRYEIVDDNKTFMSFNVGGKLSILDFIVAGKRKSSLGASRSYRFAHMTEVANYGDAKGLENFLQTLSQGHPDRLFIKESTADGYNHWHTMCQVAKADRLSQRFFFTGWWSRDDQTIPRHDPRFAEYMADPWDTEELELQAEVAREYGVLVTDEQLAWYRWYSTKSLDEGMLHQTQPWTERQAFVLTGRSFFPIRKVEKDLAVVYAGAEGSEYDFDAYRYDLGNSFETTNVERAFTLEDADLKVWSDPVPWGRYAVGCDPAYGRSDWNDSHAIQVCRCFADKLVIEAEYGSTEPPTFQVTWALAHLGSMYEDCYINYEVSGPGTAIKTELDRMRQILRTQEMAEIVRTKGWERALEGIRWYLYHRPDSLAKGYAYGWRCLSFGTRLPTPTGWTTMGAVEKGDWLLGDDGKPCQVLGVSPIHMGHPCYNVVFDDDTVIVADAAHLWKVSRQHWKGADKFRRTDELLPGRHSIRLPTALDLPEAPLPIDPYILGVWLGDGHSGSGRFYAGGRDMLQMSKNLRECGAELGPIRHDRTVSRRVIYDLVPKLRWLKLLNNKHIPLKYLRASFTQRLALLQGLMDTDGTAVSGRSRCGFTTTNSRLQRDFSELLNTLGIKATYVIRNRMKQYGNDTIQEAESYQFSFTVYTNTPPFRLPRKLATVVPQAAPTRPLRSRARRVMAVSRIESVPVKCVLVDNASHLFLASESFIPTHNTTLDNKIAIMNELRDSYINGLLIIRSVRVLEQMQYIVQDGSEIGPEAKGRKHDDFVFALALAHRAWLDWIRPDMIADGYTYEVAMRDDETRRRGERPGIVAGIVGQWFQNKEQERTQRADNPWALQRGLRR